MSFDYSSLLASRVPVAREVTFGDGTVATLYFIVPSAADVRRWHEAERGTEDERIYGMQRLIAASLFDADKGALVFGADQYKGLTYAGCNALLPHVLDVAGVTSEKKAQASPGADTSSSATS